MVSSQFVDDLLTIVMQWCPQIISQFVFSGLRNHPARKGTSLPCTTSHTGMISQRIPGGLWLIKKVSPEDFVELLRSCSLPRNSAPLNEELLFQRGCLTKWEELFVQREGAPLNACGQWTRNSSEWRAPCRERVPHWVRGALSNGRHFWCRRAVLQRMASWWMQEPKLRRSRSHMG